MLTDEASSPASALAIMPSKAATVGFDARLFWFNKIFRGPPHLYDTSGWARGHISNIGLDARPLAAPPGARNQFSLVMALSLPVHSGYHLPFGDVHQLPASKTDHSCRAAHGMTGPTACGPSSLFLSVGVVPASPIHRV